MINALKVIERELRGEARQGVHYWLRFVSGLIAVGLVAVLLWSHWEDRSNQGGEIFSALQATVYSLLWIFVPVLTCDCISRERREGTLDLLLLTPLTPLEVAVAKGFSNALRSLTFLAAMAPVVMIPIMLGGVTALDLARAVMMDVMALLGAITAGMAASTACERQHRAVALSLVFSSGLALGLGNLLVAYHLLREEGFGILFMEATALSRLFTAGAWAVPAGALGVWSEPTFATTPAVMVFNAMHLALTGALLLWVLRLASRRMHRPQGSASRTGYRRWWWRWVEVPRCLAAPYQRWKTRSLERNPIGWLYARTWNVRSTKYVVTLGIIFYDLLELDHFEVADTSQLILAWLLALLISFSAALSFRKERESRALELLLVTPLTIGQIVGGRLRALWWQFLPALGLLLIGWYYAHDSARLRTFIPSEPWLALPIATAFVANWLLLPVIGLYQSLVRRSFYIAWLVTLLLGVGLPVAVPFLGWVAGSLIETSIVRAMIGVAPNASASESELMRYWIATAIGLQICLAAASGMGLFLRLKHRWFCESG